MRLTVSATRLTSARKVDGRDGFYFSEEKSVVSVYYVISGTEEEKCASFQ